MKKVLIIITSLIVLCLTTLGIIGFFVEKNEVKNQEIIEQNIEDKKIPGVVLDANSLDINNIEGFKPGGEILKSDENSDNVEIEETSEQEKKQDEIKEEIEVGGLTLPYTVPYKEVDIISIGAYSGKFVEDGSDKSKKDTLAMVIKNTSKETIDYGKIIFKIPGNNSGVILQFSNLKPGASALVLESTGKISFNEEDKYIFLDSRIETREDMSHMSEEIKITAKEKEITIDNLSENNLNTVYVYYKTVDKGGCYMGGITYRVKFEKVTAAKSITEKTIHFSPKNSEIIMVESVKE